MHRGSPMNPTTALTFLHPAMLTATWLMSLLPLHLGVPTFETPCADAISSQESFKLQFSLRKRKKKKKKRNTGRAAN